VLKRELVASLSSPPPLRGRGKDEAAKDRDGDGME
jgi:hypothetical protein